MSNNKFKILIIEDEANICSFIQTLLETNGYQALVAQTCVMGMTMFISYNPDLVIQPRPARPGRSGRHPLHPAEVSDPHHRPVGPHHRAG